MGNLSTPKSVQKLQTALHAKAKAEAGYRFYALYDKISREDTLAQAYAQPFDACDRGKANSSAEASTLWRCIVRRSRLLWFCAKIILPVVREQD